VEPEGIIDGDTSEARAPVFELIATRFPLKGAGGVTALPVKYLNPI
jgi:hypothetical protein